MSLDLTSVVVSAVTAASTLGVAWGAKRVTPRQERRDDFTLITTNLRTDLTGVKKELAEAKTEMTTLKRRADDGDELTRWLVRWLRAFVWTMRESQQEIPPRPQPEPPQASELLQDLGV
jgi:hypothetical protein